MAGFGGGSSFGQGMGAISHADQAVIKSCQQLIHDYMRTSSDEFSILKEELGLSGGGGSRMMQITGVEKLGMSASHSRDQRSLYSMLISKIDEISNDIEVFDSLLDSLVEIERVWCLCEIFQFNQQGKLLSLDFARWLYETGRKDTEVAMSFFEALDKPEFHTGKTMTLEVGGSVDGYWQSVYTFAVQGSLDKVWDLLCLHSEFPRIDVSTTGHSNFGHGHDGGDIVSELRGILSSHPYLSSVVREDTSTVEAPSSSLLSRDLMIWTERIQRLRQSGSGFLGRIPQLLKLLDILAGNQDSLKEASNDDWLLLTLGKLLYMYSPPLSRSNLEKILEQSIASTKPSSAFSGSAAKTEMQQNTVRNIVGGEVGVAIRHIYEGRKSVESNFSSSLGLTNLLFLMPSILLCYLLIHGCEITDLNEPLDPQDPHSGYFDRLIVLMAQDLSRLKFPLPVIVNMVNTPSASLTTDLSLHVLPTVPVDSDDEARQLADAIRGQANTITNILDSVRRELYTKANEVLVARGLFWLGKNEQGIDRNEYGKAISFFSAADDVSRSTGIIDLMTRRVIEAVQHSPQFPSFPVKASKYEHNDRDLGALLAETKAVLGNISHATYLTSFTKGMLALYEIGKHSQPQEGDAKGLENAIHSLSFLASEGQMPKRYLIFLLATIVFANDLFLKARAAFKEGQPHVASSLPKAMVYDLIAKLELHITSFNAEESQNNSASSSIWGTTDLAVLRRKLLAMLSSSCLGENAFFRHLRVGRESANDQSSSPVGNGKPAAAPVTSLDLLGGVALY